MAFLNPMQNTSCFVANVGGKTVDAIFGELLGRINTMLANASLQIDNEFTNMLNQINMSALALQNELNYNLSNRIDQISAVMQQKLNSLDYAVNLLELQVKDHLDDLIEDTMAAVEQAVANVYPATDQVKITGIKGTLIPFEASSTHPVKITGVGFGFKTDDAEHVSFITLRVGETESRIEGVPVDEQTTQYDIPCGLFAGLRNAETCVSVDVVLTAKVLRDRFIIGDLFGHKTYSLDTPIRFTLACKYCGTARVKIVVANCKWTRHTELDQTVTIRTPSGHPQGSHYTTPVTLKTPNITHTPPHVGDQRFIKFYLNRVVKDQDGASGFSKHWARVSEGGTTCEGSYENWSHSVDIEFKGEVERFDFVSTTEQPEQSIKFVRGDIITLSVQKMFSGVSIVGRINSKPLTCLINSPTIGQYTGAPDTVGQPWHFLGMMDEVDHIVFSFQVKETV